MQKNEEVLLRPWAALHGEMVDPANVTIFDNGSTSVSVQEQLKCLADQGFNVIFKYNTEQDFEQKGSIVRDQILEFDATDPADFYIPLDCDEFLYTSQAPGESLCFTRRALENALRPYIGSDSALRIGSSYDNYPIAMERGRFINKGRQKCFLTQGHCRNVDLGFHKIQSWHHYHRIRTRVGQLHMHNKPLAALLQSAREKLNGRVRDFSDETLDAFKAKLGRGYHLVDELRCSSEAEYETLLRSRYENLEIVDIPEFNAHLEMLGCRIAYH